MKEASRGYNPWGAVHLVRHELGLTENDWGPLSAKMRGRIDQELETAIDELEDGYADEARTMLVDALCSILDARAGLRGIAPVRSVPGISEPRILGSSRWSAVFEASRDSDGLAVIVKVPLLPSDDDEDDDEDDDFDSDDYESDDYESGDDDTSEDGETTGEHPDPMDTVGEQDDNGDRKSLFDPFDVIRRQGEMLAGLHHDPLFVDLIDHGETEDGTPYIVLPELLMGSLRDRMMRDLVPPSLFSHLARGLNRCRQEGLLRAHGDLKPEHVLFGADGQPRLIDPAIIDWGEGGGPVRYLFTPAYSPIGHPSDVAALALTAIEAVTGAHPFAASDLDMRQERAVAPALVPAIDRAHSRRIPFRHLPRIPLPSQLGANPAEQWDALLLSSLGVIRNADGMLDVRAEGQISLLELAERFDAL